MKVEARECRSGQWRPATVIRLTPLNTRVGAGAYIQWDDVDIHDLSKSQGGWQPVSCIRVPGVPSSSSSSKAETLMEPLRKLYRSGQTKPSAIAVSPAEFDSLCDVTAAFPEVVAALRQIEKTLQQAYLVGAIDVKTQAHCSIATDRDSIRAVLKKVDGL